VIRGAEERITPLCKRTRNAELGLNSADSKKITTKNKHPNIRRNQEMAVAQAWKSCPDNVSWRGTTATHIALLIIAVAGAFRMITLTAKSMWLDELYSVTSAAPDLSLGEVWERIMADVHPPLYQLFLHYWMELFGTTEFAVRMPSLIAIIASAIFAIWYFRPLIGEGVTGIFAVFLTTAYGSAWYAQEARSYALVIFFSVVLTGASLRIAENYRGGQEDSGALLLFAVTATILPFLHYFGFILYCASAAAIVLIHLSRLSLRWRIMPYLAIPAAPAMAWTFYHYSHLSPKTLSNFWIAPPAIGDFLGFLSLSFGIPYFVLALLPVLALAIMRRDRNSRSIALFGAIAISIGIMLALAISLRHPVITARNLLIFMPITLLLVSASIGWLLERPAPNTAMFPFDTRKGVAVFLVVLVAGFGQSVAVAGQKSNWRAAAAYLLSNESCRNSAIFVMGGYGAQNHAYYTNGRHADVAIRFIDLTGKKRPAESDIREVLGNPCPVVLWGVKNQAYSQEWVETEVFGDVEGELVMTEFKGNVLFLHRAAEKSAVNAER
jgi:mannosyltransferase